MQISKSDDLKTNHDIQFIIFLNFLHQITSKIIRSMHHHDMLRSSKFTHRTHKPVLSYYVRIWTYWNLRLDIFNTIGDSEVVTNCFLAILIGTGVSSVTDSSKL